MVVLDIEVLCVDDCIQKKPGEPLTRSPRAQCTPGTPGMVVCTRVVGCGGDGRLVVVHRGTGPGAQSPLFKGKSAKFTVFSLFPQKVLFSADSSDLTVCHF